MDKNRIRKCVVSKVSSNALKMQTLQVHGTADELVEDAEHYQMYGFSSFPMPIESDGKGAEGVMVDLNSATSMQGVLCVDDRRYRPKNAVKGDVQIYHSKDSPTAAANVALARITLTDDGGANYRLIAKINLCKLEMKSNNDILIENGGASIQIFANGNITINGAAVVINCDTLDINEN